MVPAGPTPTVVPGSTSTLGVSGQTLPPPAPRRSRRVLVGVGAGLGIVIVLGIFGADWLSSSKAVTPPAAPPIAPRVARPSVAAAQPTPTPEAAPIKEAAPVKKPDKPIETHVKPKAPIARHTPVGPRRGPATSRPPQSNASPPPGKKLIPVED
jgi:hypothetical protein